MYHQVIDTAAEKMQKTTSVLQGDLRSIRAGRANPQLLERVVVDYYGVQTPLTQMGNITAPEPRMLVISVWDQKALPLVEKAIIKSDLGLNPSNDGKIIRLVIPELNEERRKELTKVVRKTVEEAKVAVRSIRRDAMEQIKKMEKNGDITE
ncbi:MAG: ribosome recycling factor, partial [Clostridia bacterium]|nr:ribosome recycling factor [Clostridia bacterium]